VPLCGETESFEDTLVSVLQNRPAQSEVIVVTPGEYDDPYDLAEEVSFIPAPSGAELPVQINLGVRAGRGDVVHVVQCGLTVDEGWTDAVLPHFADDTVAAVAPAISSIGRAPAMIGIRAGFNGRRVEVLTRREGDGSLTALARSHGPTLLAGFWRKTAWERAGGLDANLGPNYADLDLAVTFEELGFRCVAEPACRILRQAAAPQPPSRWRQGKSAERLFWKHARGASRGAYAIHALGLAAEFVTALPRPGRMIEFLGRLSVLGSGDWSESRNAARPSLREQATAGSEPIRRRDSANLLSERDRRPPARNAVQPF
jgi:hypothetical protein